MSGRTEQSDKSFFRSTEEGKWLCLLCPHACVLCEGQSGLCRVRTADAEGIRGPEFPVTVIGSDPVEKKPFYHFLPGTQTLSLGFAGCNLRCPFCQNHELVDSRIYRQDLSPERIVEIALRENALSVSFTYSEPLIHIEFLIELSILLHRQGIKTLLVTNGCINPEPGAVLLKHMDGVKVDLKSFNREWYRKELGGDLDAVLAFIRQAAESKSHLEVVTLVVPGRNDNPEELGSSAAFLLRSWTGVSPFIFRAISRDTVTPFLLPKPRACTACVTRPVNTWTMCIPVTSDPLSVPIVRAAVKN